MPDRQRAKYAAALAAAAVIGLELPPAKGIEAGRDLEPDMWVKAVCRYCNSACGAAIGIKRGKIVAVKGDRDSWNKGFLCIKAFAALSKQPEDSKCPLRLDTA